MKRINNEKKYEEIETIPNSLDSLSKNNINTDKKYFYYTIRQKKILKEIKNTLKNQKFLTTEEVDYLKFFISAKRF